MIGYVFYFIYFALSLCILTPFICKGKYIHLSMLPLLFFPHFNTTCFLKLGLTFSFFEIYLFAFSFLILLTGFSLTNAFRLNVSGKIFGLFLIISILSIFIAQFRIGLGNLKPSTFYGESPGIRSLMSLNRLFVYPVLLPYIRTFYVKKGVDISFYFKKYLAYSGIIPSIAVILQACGIECLLLFNNPSFSESVGWASPGRPFGLSYEASFYAFMCLFSFVGVYYAVRDNIISSSRGYILYTLYAMGVLLCISRTGMLVFILIQVVQVIIPILPGGVSCLGGVIFFGPWLGFLYNYIGICIGSIAVFGISKTIGRPVLYKMFSEKMIEKYDGWTQKDGKFLKLFALAIFFPVAPDDFLCYLAGTTKMTWKQFTAVIVLGKPFSIALYSLGLTTAFKMLFSL